MPRIPYLSAVLLLATAIPASVKAESVCPGSPAWKHAKCEMTVHFPKSDCTAVRNEILSRIAGQDGWTDPHNRGTYLLADSDDDVTRASRTTKDEKYTDLLGFSFRPTSANGCEVRACSESQVFSILDFSTNYCNLRSLYCDSSQDGCPVIGSDLEYDERYTSCSQRDVSKCIVRTVLDL